MQQQISLVRAVLANNRGWASQTSAVDSERVLALEVAARPLPGADPRRARVLALLAEELHFAGDPARCRALATEAIEMARAAGDPSALAHTLNSAFWAILVPETLQERKRLADELVELAERLDDLSLSWRVGAGRELVGLETGDRSQVESGLAAMRAVAAALPDPWLGHRQLVCDSSWAFAQGELQTAEEYAIQAYAAGTASGQPDAVMLFGLSLFQLRYFQGRLGELVEQSVRVAGDQDNRSLWRATAALALVESGRADETRKLALAEDFRSVPRDILWLGAMFFWADACSRLGLQDRADELYELLSPFPDQLVTAGAVVVEGSIPWALGTLATTLERYEQAEGHFATAAEIEQRFGAPLLLARTRAGWAHALIAHGRPEDGDRAQQLLEQAEDASVRLGAELVAGEVAKGRAALAAISG